MKAIKYIGFILFLCVAFDGHTQVWQDTLNKARKCYEDGKYKEALKYYKSLDTIAPKNVDLSQEKGQTAYRAGDFATATESFQRYADKQTDTKKKVRATLNTGSSQMKEKNFDGAIESFKTSLRLDPDNEKARQLLVEAKRLKKQQEEKEQKEKQDQDKKSGSGKDQNQDKNQNNQNNQNSQNQKDSKDQKSQDAKSGQLQDKQTERKLDELSRQEQGTKRRLEGGKGKKGGKTARKDW